MERVDVEDLAPAVPCEGVECRGLTGALGTEGVAVNHYRVAPGEGFPAGLHAHLDQEELFVVLEGEATFETYAPDGDAGRVTVGTGEAIRFAPGEFQSGDNDADGRLVALAIGAPRDSERLRLPLACPGCGRPDVRLDTEGGPEFVCPDCGDARVPAPCPDCGSQPQVALGEDHRPVVVCPDCGAEFEEPPVRG